MPRVLQVVVEVVGMIGVGVVAAQGMARCQPQQHPFSSVQRLR